MEKNSIKFHMLFRRCVIFNYVFSSSHIHAYTLLMLFFSFFLYMENYITFFFLFCCAYTWNNYFNDVYWMSEMEGYSFISELLYFDSIICLFYLFTYASVSVCTYIFMLFTKLNFSDKFVIFFGEHSVMLFWMSEQLTQ